MQEKNSYSENLHEGAKPSTFENARSLRLTETKAEKILWEFLLGRRLLGHKFRRQHAVLNFVLDFYCHGSKLAIELDGGIHDEKVNKSYDEMRTTELNDSGIRVLRFRNDEVINDPDNVLEKIREQLE